jgi:hypothetical protein
MSFALVCQASERISSCEFAPLQQSRNRWPAGSGERQGIMFAIAPVLPFTESCADWQTPLIGLFSVLRYHIAGQGKLMRSPGIDRQRRNGGLMMIMDGAG